MSVMIAGGRRATRIRLVSPIFVVFLEIGFACSLSSLLCGCAPRTNTGVIEAAEESPQSNMTDAQVRDRVDRLRQKAILAVRDRLDPEYTYNVFYDFPSESEIAFIFRPTWIPVFDGGYTVKFSFESGELLSVE